VARSGECQIANPALTEQAGSNTGRSGVEYFVGTHERQLDPKGRLALPAAYRPRFEPSCYCLMGSQHCVAVLTADDSRQVIADTIAAVERGETTTAELRALAASMIEVEVDRQGRILLDERLRRYAGLELNTKVVVAGAFTRLEIWAPTTFEAETATGQERIAAAGVTG
jgi:MraZ protein